MKLMPAYALANALALAFSSGCATTPTTVAEANPDCPASANLLADPSFATLGQGGKRVWRQRQHSRGRDFNATATGGVLTISKIGHEPWFVVSQRLPDGIGAGVEFQYDAFLTLDTVEPEHPHGFGYVSGLYLQAKSAGGKGFRRLAEHDPNLGQHSEQRVVSRFTAESDLRRVEAGFVHQAGGSLAVRAPRLINVSAHPACRLP